MTSRIDERKVRIFSLEVCKNSEPHVEDRDAENISILVDVPVPKSDLMRRHTSQFLALWMLLITVAFLWMSISPLLQDSYIRRDPAWTVAVL